MKDPNKNYNYIFIFYQQTLFKIRYHQVFLINYFIWLFKIINYCKKKNLILFLYYFSYELIFHLLQNQNISFRIKINYII